MYRDSTDIAADAKTALVKLSVKWKKIHLKSFELKEASLDLVQLFEHA